MVKKKTRKVTEKKNVVDFKSVVDQPLLFLNKLNNPGIEKLKTDLKTFYDRLKINETKPSNSKPSLPELVIKNFDFEQIWQQIDLQNVGKLRTFKRQCAENEEFSKLFQSANVEEENEEVESNNSDDAEESGEDFEKEANQLFGNSSIEIENEEESDKEESENEESADTVGQKNRQERFQNVEDKFFKLDDMEAFLEAEDKKESKKMSNYQEGDDEDLEEINYFTDDEVEVEDLDNMQGGKCRYKGFFDPPQQSSNKKVTFAEDHENGEENDEEIDEEDGDEADDDETVPKSSFETRQKRLKEKITELEEENLSGKSWQQIGEVTAKSRPENSLLEEHLLFDHATRPAPIITQQTTLSLEDRIKQRIKDKAWDDVERKIKPINQPYKYKNDLVLDQEKSKISLSEIYEKEFLKQTQKETEEVKNPKHEEIRRLMKNLFIKLDALTNYHYTPKLPASEIKVVNNMKSIAMEEVAPVTVGDGDLLAPEEIKSKSRGDVKAKEERTKIDKNRERRKKKFVTKMKIKRKEEKEKSSSVKTPKVPKDKMKLLEKVGKVHKSKTDGSVGQKRNIASSAQFFAQLQSQTSSDTVPKKKSKKLDNRFSSGSIKLAS